MNYHGEIQHSKIGLACSNLECEGSLVISKVGSVLVLDDLFPRSDDGLEKYKLNMCMEIIIIFWSGIMCFESDIIDMNMFKLLIWIMEKRIVLNKNKFRMLLL